MAVPSEGQAASAACEGGQVGLVGPKLVPLTTARSPQLPSGSPLLRRPQADYCKDQQQGPPSTTPSNPRSRSAPSAMADSNPSAASGSNAPPPPPVIIPNTVNPPKTAPAGAGAKPKMIFKPVVPVRKREPCVPLSHLGAQVAIRHLRNALCACVDTLSTWLT